MPALPSAPDAIPVLSRGKHRTPRKGACFMELASVLAGERWSDHPRCTHPLLGELARHVNDCISDEQRQTLALVVPSVVGVTSDDVRVDAVVALHCAAAALPVAAEERQNVLAVSVLTAEHVLAELDGRPPGDLTPAGRAALDAVPHAEAWARRFVGSAGISVKGFRRHAAPNTVRGAVRALAEACVPDTDARLCRLLTEVVAECRELCGVDEAEHPGTREAPESVAVHR